MENNNQHKNYEILNLIGYGLSKFDNSFINEFGYSNKNQFYLYCVELGIVETIGTVKNRMDLFDPFFPNKRKGWWQKGDTYIHRKLFIDNLFGNETVSEFADIVKLYMKNSSTLELKKFVKPIVQSKFKKLQETGLEAELYFMNNYRSVSLFQYGELEDARLFGDGYDFQVNIENDYFLTEVKGIRANKGKFRLTENEFNKAVEYKNKFIITVVLNLNKKPYFVTIEDPIRNLSFIEKVNISKEYKEYHVKENIC
jgi:hypothetical protein